MYIKAEYKNISSLGEYLVSRAEDYKKDVDDMIGKLEELENYWSGPDYDNYKEVYKVYLQNIKTTYIELNAFGNALMKVSSLYSEQDNKFGNTMRKMVDDNGRSSQLS